MDTQTLKRRTLTVLALASATAGAFHLHAQSLPRDAYPALLKEYEQRFVPSAFDVDTSRQSVGLLPSASLGADSVGTGELVQGFRVQVSATTDIDSVNARKAQAEVLFPGELFYVDFDPPAYKLRAGNFLTRFEADRFARTMAARGFPDAWAVPARVFKNPQRPIPPPTGADSLPQQPH
jgi:hypothetical protein